MRSLTANRHAPDHRGRRSASSDRQATPIRRPASNWRPGPRSILGVCALLFAVGPSPARCQSWPDEHVSGPFYYHADFSLGSYHELLAGISQLQQEVPATLALGQVEEPIHVFLFQQPTTYQRYVRTYFPQVPNRPALFIKQRGPGMVFAHLGRNIAIDLRHETTHAVLHSILPMVPLWLDEGLGEYFEMPQSERTSGHPHLKSTKDRLRWGYTPKIESLEQLGDIQEMKPQHYRDAWAYTHFLLHGPPLAKETLLTFLAAIQAHVPPGQLSRQLRHQLPDLEGAFREHFRNWPTR